jgi:hypothetical protein
MHSFYPRAANGTASGLTNSALHHLLNESIYLVDLTGESLHPPPPQEWDFPAGRA